MKCSKWKLQKLGACYFLIQNFTPNLCSKSFLKLLKVAWSQNVFPSSKQCVKKLSWALKCWSTHFFVNGGKVQNFLRLSNLLAINKLVLFMAWFLAKEIIIYERTKMRNENLLSLCYLALNNKKSKMFNWMLNSIDSRPDWKS